MGGSKAHKSVAEAGIPLDQLDWSDTFDVYVREGDPSSTKYTNIIGYNLTDGSQRYGCKPCGMTYSKMGATRRHLGAEHPSDATLARRAARAAAEKPAKPAPAVERVDQAAEPAAAEPLYAPILTGDEALDSRISMALMMFRGVIANLVSQRDREAAALAPVRAELADARRIVRERDAELKTLRKTYGPLIRAAERLTGNG